VAQRTRDADSSSDIRAHPENPEDHPSIIDVENANQPSISERSEVANGLRPFGLGTPLSAGLLGQ
jgi:hypothetical protein